MNRTVVPCFLVLSVGSIAAWASFVEVVSVLAATTCYQ
jgi:hypothetical protein